MTNPAAKWMRKEDDQLRAAAASGETVAAISKRLCRSESGVLHRADKLGIELASRQAPVGRDRGPQMSPHHSNDDKSPLIDLLVCIICRETMKIEKSTPDAEGTEIIQYRCGRCDRIERVRLFRRSRDAAALKAKGK